MKANLIDLSDVLMLCYDYLRREGREVKTKLTFSSIQRRSFADKEIASLANPV